MIKKNLIFINFSIHSSKICNIDLIKMYEASTYFINFLPTEYNIKYIYFYDKNYNGNKILEMKLITYFFYTSYKPNTYYLPIFSMYKIKKFNPDFVWVHGLIFPFHLLMFQLILKSNVKLIVQHHGEKILNKLKKWLVNIANINVNAIVFTSIEIAKHFFHNKTIQKKSIEILEASTLLTPMDYIESKEKLGISNFYNFLWVGRLNANKDPIYLINQFVLYFAIQPLAKLYMIYQTEELLVKIEEIIKSKPYLKNHIILLGKQNHMQLRIWYSACNYYVSASFSEGSGYALLEALACGCLPIVSNIPSFKKILNNGEVGYLFEKEKKNQLFEILKTLTPHKYERQSIVNYFNTNLNFINIAKDTHNLLNQL